MKMPMPAPTIGDVVSQLEDNAFERIFLSGVKASQDGQYRHWDQIRHRPPPENLSLQEWWAAIKFARQREYHILPFTDEAEQAFRYMMPDRAWERVHQLDQRLGGQITLSEEVTSPSTRDRYLVNSLIEESITSSQLEGASTSRRVAKEMLKTGRPPRDKSERMILNNYRAMNFVRNHRNESLNPEFVLELHRIVTDRTLDDPAEAGRLQLLTDERVQVISPEGQLLHNPPPAEQLPARLMDLCEFANGQDIGAFLHPVVRAIMIHFRLAYDHPFADGNGRTARALFYWSMLSQRYWLAEFIAISKILQEARTRYDRSFLYTETDELDVTYFVMYQLEVIMEATNQLEEYLKRKMIEVKQTEKLIKGADFNHRQVALLSHALRHPDQEYTVQSHQKSNNVVQETARTDLIDLEDRGLLSRHKIGRAYGWTPVPDLQDRLQEN